MEDNSIAGLMQRAFSGEPAPEQEAVQETQPQEAVADSQPKVESVEAKADSDISSLNSESSVESTEPVVEKTVAETPTPKFANEQIAELNEWVSKTGRDVSEYLALKTTDYNAMSDVDLLKSYFKQTNPQFSEEEIDLYMEEQYRINAEPGSREYKLAQMRMKSDAKTAREDFEEYRSNLLKVKVEQTKQPEQKVEVPKENSPLDIFSNGEFRSQLEMDANSLDGITFELNDSESFTYQLNDQQRSDLAKSSSDINSFFNRYTTSDGKFNLEKWNMDRFLIDNLDQVVRAVNNQSRSSATESVIKDMKNVDSSAKVSNTDQQNVNTLEAQILNELFSNPFKRK